MDLLYSKKKHTQQSIWIGGNFRVVIAVVTIIDVDMTIVVIVTGSMTVVMNCDCDNNYICL